METDPSGVMEGQLVERYLQARGHTLRSVRALPEPLRRPLLAAAASYASLMMTEAETEHRTSIAGIDVGTPDP